MSDSHHAAIATASADTISAGAIVASFLGWLPPIAAIAAILWYVIQIYESRTFQKWVRLQRRRRRQHQALKRIANAAVQVTEAHVALNAAVAQDKADGPPN
jgi:hypothetical protein